MTKEETLKMRRDALLLNVDSLPKYTSLRVNIEANTLAPFIRMGKKRLKKVFTTKLYNKIADDWNKDQLKGVYDEIYEDHFAPLLCYYTLYYLCTLHAVQITESGLHTIDADGATAIDLEEAEKIAKRYYHLASEAIEDFKDFIKTNRVKEYDNGDSCESRGLEDYFTFEFLQ